LLCYNDDTNDKLVPNLEGMDVYDGTRMYLQIVEMDLGKATELESSLLGIRIELLSEGSASVMDPLSNAARKAPPLDAIIVKQEAG
jgi:hypothetical protein